MSISNLRTKAFKVAAISMSFALLGGCKLGGVATGLTDPVVLYDEISAQQTKVGKDGTFTFSKEFPTNSSFSISVMEASGQDCKLTNSKGRVFGNKENIILNCGQSSCPTIYQPVCGKVQTNVVCVKDPCLTYEYRTFSNRCEVAKAKAKEAFDGQCKGIESKPASGVKPVQMVRGKPNVQLGPAIKLKTAKVVGDVMVLELDHKGGCGEHDFNLFLDGSFVTAPMLGGEATEKPQPGGGEIGYTIQHITGDKCLNDMTSKVEFDVQPLFEYYRRITGNFFENFGR